MKRFAMSVVLACALSGGALAGDIPSSGIVSPPPPPDETVQGDVPSTGVTLPDEMPYVSMVLTALELVF
jgi:hypothetical protein